MSLFQQACRTYDFMEKNYMGVYPPEKGEPLCPISHIITAAQIEIVLDKDSHFIRASEIDKSEPKIIIPATEESAGRSGTKAIERPHPLCDMLKYMVADNGIYMTNLKKWKDSEFTHPKISAIYQYLLDGRVIDDLNRFGINDAMEKMIRWRIIDPFGSSPEECWKDRSLFRAFADYYAHQKCGTVFCMVSGRDTAPASQHPKGIIAIKGNAKLISANDSSGFTYRGRFTEDWQAATVSYEVSQKAHAALRWLIVNQGDFIGGRTFICWNPEGIRVCSPKSPLHRSKTEIRVPSDYQEALRKTLLGSKEELPKDAQAIIASFDAATTGRLSLTYYNKLTASDFLDRLHVWDSYCCWWFGSKQFPGNLFSPYLQTIVDCAYGTERNGRLETDERVMAQQFQRLMACRISKAKMPADIVQRLVNRASMPQMYSEDNWRKIVSTACAAIQKYEEVFFMEWPLDKQDRSFQFGRLLAAMERAEADYYYKSKEDRQTNAIKSLSVFKQTPWSVFARIDEKLQIAYLPRIESWQKTRYCKLRDEIIGLISRCTDEEPNAPLSPYYLMGYGLQRNEFFKTNDKSEEE